jgi:hypothetical protein
MKKFFDSSNKDWKGYKICSNIKQIDDIWLEDENHTDEKWSCHAYPSQASKK